MELFMPANPAYPSFVVDVTTTPTVVRLESGQANWDGLTEGRTVRLASMGPEDFYVSFGEDWVTVDTAVGMLILGGTVEAFNVGEETHMAVVSTAPTRVNVTIGRGA